jgi:ASPIC and UnbV
VPLHFGLGAAESADVEVVWPGGERQPLGKLAAGKTWRVRRGAAPEDMIPTVRSARP